MHAGDVTTCGSKILEGWRPPYDATVVDALRRAGAIALGKTNMDEFAMGSSTENSAFGPTRNPRHPGKVPGGSSGGSAAAVAAGFVPLGLGSDTGGSIRQPAALCGVVGMKPTYGRVSRYGLVAFASSLDQIGPFATTVEDAALLFDVVAGHDPRDSTSLPSVPEPTLATVHRGAEGIGSGSAVTWSTAAHRTWWRGCRRRPTPWPAPGRRWRRSSVPEFAYGLSAYYLIAPAEASSNLARYDGVRYGLRVDGEDADGHEHGDAHGRIRCRGQAPRSCSAPTRCRPGTTTPTTPRRSGCARSSCRRSTGPTSRSTCCSARPRRRPPSTSAPRWTTRWRCT